MVKKHKTAATAPNEVTVTIMSNKQKTNYHETFLMDLSKDHFFEFNGFKYSVPSEKTMHYAPSFWRFDLKLSFFFEQHKTLAKFFDWFNFKSKAVYEVGYLYDEGTESPIEIAAPQVDWAQENYKLLKNTTIEASFVDVDNKLRGKNDHMNLLMLLGALIIGIVAIVVIITFMNGGITPAQHIQPVNSTLTNSSMLSNSTFPEVFK